MPELELTLRQLGAELDWPPEPTLAPRVAVAIRAPRRRRSLRRPLALGFAVLVLAVAVAMAVPPARSAILDLLHIGGVDIQRVETLPELPAGSVAPGVRVPLDDALDSVPFDVVVPEGYRNVYLAEGEGIVTFVWPDRLLMELSGDKQLLKKVVDQDSTLAMLDVNGYPAVWIEGGPHGLFVPGGEARLAGNTLIWVRDGVTFRLEGDMTRQRALELAGTLTPR
jgi:hypothetical protein